jgi:hypothetical protein
VSQLYVVLQVFNDGLPIKYLPFFSRMLIIKKILFAAFYSLFKSMDSVLLSGYMFSGWLMAISRISML